jgi:anti-anti-sigma factor
MAPRRRLGAVSLDAIGAGVAVMTLTGEFHHRETRDLERALGDSFDGAYQHLVVDMRGVDLFGAPSLRTLVKAALRARERGMGFAIVRPDQDIWQAFELTGLDSQLTNSASLEAALDALSRAD